MEIVPTYTYYIDNFEIILADNGLTNIIKTIHIIIVATHSHFTESSYFAMQLQPPSEESFITYESLTKEIVLGWINECTDLIFLTKKEELKKKINESANKPIIIIKPNFF